MQRLLPIGLAGALLLVGLNGAQLATGRTDDGPRIAAVGDIACKSPPGNNVHACRYDAVSDLVANGTYDAFLALGDNQYESGGYTDYVRNYDAYFGRFLALTYPVPGNHEYSTPDAAGYFQYFGSIARGPDGWYSFDLGGWHVIALNSAICSPYTGSPCGPGTPEYEWLKADLAAHPNSAYPCTLAYWHHPVWDWEKYQKITGSSRSTTIA